MDVYSIPMTPAPTTHIVRGSCFRRTMSSVLRTTSPSLLTPGEGAGWVPTAIRMCSAVTRRRPVSPSISSVCASANEATPDSTLTSLRRSWLSITSTSRAITLSTPAKSCWQVGRASRRAQGSRSPRPARPEKVTTASRRVLLGMVPVSMHAPPTERRFSTTAARRPSFEACTAARWPAGPLPMQTRSKS